VRAAYLSLLSAEDLKVYLDSIIGHSLKALCRATLFILLVNVHGDLIA